MFNRRAQFPNIAASVMNQGFHCSTVKSSTAFSFSAANSRRKRWASKDVHCPLAQRRQIISRPGAGKTGPRGSCPPDLRLQIPVRGGHQPRPQSAFVRAHALEGAFARKRSSLIWSAASISRSRQKQRAALRLFKSSMRRSCAPVNAPFRAEQLAFEQRGGQGSTMHVTMGCWRAGELVDGLGHDFLALPLSPSSKIEAREGATWRTTSNTSCIAGDSPRGVPPYLVSSC